MKAIEKENKEVDSKNKDEDREVQVRLGDFASVVAQTQNAVRALEGRLGLAVDAAGRTAADGLAAFSERYDEQIKGLSEQLGSLERVQSDLRALIESDRREHRDQAVGRNADTSMHLKLHVHIELCSGTRRRQNNTAENNVVTYVAGMLGILALERL